jgi:hypothetical protein
MFNTLEEMGGMKEEEIRTKNILTNHSAYFMTTPSPRDPSTSFDVGGTADEGSGEK